MTDSNTPSAPVVIGAADGLVPFQIGSEAATVDVWAAYWHLVEAGQDRPSPADWNARAASVMRRAGFAGDYPTFVVELFARHVFEQVEGLKKKVPGLPRPGSPGSTAQPPSA